MEIIRSDKVYGEPDKQGRLRVVINNSCLQENSKRVAPEDYPKIELWHIILILLFFVIIAYLMSSD